MGKAFKKAAKFFGIGKAAQDAAEKMSGFNLIVPDSAEASRTDNGVARFVVPCATVVSVGNEEKTNKNGVVRAQFTIKLKIKNMPEVRENVGKVQTVFMLINWDVLNGVTDVPSGDVTMNNITVKKIKSIVNALNLELDENGDIPVELLELLFSATDSPLVNQEFALEISDRPNTKEEYKNKGNQQEVETFLPVMEG